MSGSSAPGHGLVHLDMLTNEFVLTEESLHLPYGTSGYRSHANILPGIAFRIGALAALTSLKFGSRAVGVMITASHNPPEDNGMKVMGPQGEMLEPALETVYSETVKSTDFSTAIVQLASDWNVKNLLFSNRGTVLIAGDTRTSTPHLMKCVEAGVEAILSDESSGENTCCHNLGILTTPQCHYLVNEWNERSANGVETRPTVNDYYQKICSAFLGLQSFLSKDNASPEKSQVFVDCAHGVGGNAIKELAQRLHDHISIVPCNTADTEEDQSLLNSQCGADYVKMTSLHPEVKESIQHQQGHWCALDGDADRIIYWTENIADGPKESIVLLDGDRIACLFTAYMKECLSQLSAESPSLHFGMVYTAYTNSAATDYMCHTLGVDIACVKTGVKYLHKKAVEYDIGVYFEANGHGTIVFSDKAKQFIQSLNPTLSPLPHVLNLINQCCGDALSDLLLTEHILRHWGWTSTTQQGFALSSWLGIYMDWPSRQYKVKVADRYAIKTNDNETKVIEPIAVQEAVDRIVKSVQESSGGHARAFVRPSGTEDIVRVYCEAITQIIADQLAQTIADELTNILKG